MFAIDLREMNEKYFVFDLFIETIWNDQTVFRSICCPYLSLAREIPWLTVQMFLDRAQQNQTKWFSVYFASLISCTQHAE